MHQFPENYELVGFFECEPEVLDNDIPWAYNQLTFRSHSTNGSLIAEMEPGSEIMNLLWVNNGEILVQLNLIGVMSTEVGSPENPDDINTLIIKFRDDNVDELRVKVRQFIQITWGYNDHP